MTSGGGADAPARGRATLAGLLRSLRIRALLSQEQLANRSGVSVRTIRGLETGRIRVPRGGTVRLLADALGLGGQERAALAASVGGEPARPTPPQVAPAHCPPTRPGSPAAPRACGRWTRCCRAVRGRGRPRG